MSKLHWTLLALYLTAAAGFGGWRGRDLWSAWGVWWFLLPPLAMVAGKTVAEWWRNPHWTAIKMGLLMSVFAVVFIGGQALLLAWSVAEATARWSSRPTVRAIAAVGLLAAAGGVALATKIFGKAARDAVHESSVNTGGPAEPGSCT
jgi:hypothetical protein